MYLNERALEICRHMVESVESLRIATTKTLAGTLLVDCGIEVPGGLEAGRQLAMVCMSGLGRVEFVPARDGFGTQLAVQVTTDAPIAACLASQYAGWEVKGHEFFAMGSGPMRAAANRERLFEQVGHNEMARVAVGVLETGKLPPAPVLDELAAACGVAPRDLIVLLAPTSSQAGNVQVVARSIETAMHKLVELGFEIDRVASGYGVAPLPPVAREDLSGIGRTNDAILYGGEVTLWVHGDDDLLEAVGPRIPSNASADHGRPFAEIFAGYGHDFYQVDPHLFSPAVVRLCNLDTGNQFVFGELKPDVIQRSFGM